MSDDAITRLPNPLPEPDPEALTRSPHPADFEPPARRSLLDLWTRGQRMVVGVQLLLPVTWLVCLLFINFRYVQVFWTHPVGIKLGLGALVMLLMGLTFYLSGCAWLNVAMPRPDQDRSRRALCALLLLIELLFFYLPSLIAILVGPAAVQIYESFSNMNK